MGVMYLMRRIRRGPRAASRVNGELEGECAPMRDHGFACPTCR